MQPVIGVDIGGTNVRACAVGPGGEFVGERREGASRAKEGVEATLSALVEVIRQAAEGLRPAAAGVAIPGHVDGARGVVRWAPNFGSDAGGEFRCWRNAEIAGPVSSATGLPAFIGNDANLAALGEFRFGSGEGRAKGLVLLTLGTGIGSGVVVNENSCAPFCLSGATGGAVEFGHVIIQAGGRRCGCGNLGCFEAYCGTKGLLQTAVEAGVQVDSPKELFEIAKENDAARRVWEKYGQDLGIGIANAINAFNPEIVALGGQIAKASEYFMGAAVNSARKNSIPSIFEGTAIIRAKCVEDAGILGAAALAMESLK